MSRENLTQTLDAVEQALDHFAESLRRGGFEAGAPAYRQMAALVIGQRLWATEHGLTQLDEDYLRVAALAEEIRAQLSPYVEIMEQLGALAGLTPNTAGLTPLGKRIFEILEHAPKPMSATAVRSQTGGTSAAVRRELAELVERGLVKRSAQRSRVTYAPARRSPATEPAEALSAPPAG